MLALVVVAAAAVIFLIKLEKCVIESYGCGSYMLSKVPDKTVTYQFFKGL
jgi:hypothetical protein